MQLNSWQQIELPPKRHAMPITTLLLNSRNWPRTPKCQRQCVPSPKGNLAQTPEVYEHSKNALEAALETLGRSFDAVGKGVH